MLSDWWKMSEAESVSEASALSRTEIDLNLRSELVFKVKGQVDGWLKNRRSWAKFESY